VWQPGPIGAEETKRAAVEKQRGKWARSIVGETEEQPDWSWALENIFGFYKSVCKWQTKLSSNQI
jgi:hypothetical protein